ncbi:hypothetical protein QEN19_002042 [Hanseniaspora menglaensis]
MSFDSLLIINRSGGLIYNKSFNACESSSIGSNELLILAGTLHSAFTLTNCILPETLVPFSESYNGAEKEEFDDLSKCNNLSLPNNCTDLETNIKRQEMELKYFPPGSSAVKNNSINEKTVNFQSIIKGLTFKGSDFFHISDGNKNIRLSDYHQVSAIRHIGTEHIDIYCYQSVTGTKFIGIYNHEEKMKHNIDQVTCFLMRVYALYSDIVLKNPFYSLDMPIRNSERFDTKIKALVKLDTSAG